MPRERFDDPFKTIDVPDRMDFTVVTSAESLANERLLIEAIILSAWGYTAPRSIYEQLSSLIDLGYELHEAVGKLKLETRDVPYWLLGNVSRTFDAEEAARLHIYQTLTNVPDYRIAQRLRRTEFRTAIGVESTGADKTIKRAVEQVKDEFSIEAQIFEMIRDLDNRHEELIDPPEPQTDGIGVPDIVEISRELRQKAYGPIYVDRDENKSSLDKWELFRVWEHAAITGSFVNNTKEALQHVPYYRSRNVPDGRTLWSHVKDFSRGERRLMFLAALETMFREMQSTGYVPQNPDLAIDITDWPFYGTPTTTRDPMNRPPGVEGTKKGRNFAYSFQMATCSLTNVEIPFTTGIRAVSHRRTRDYHMGKLLDYAEVMVGRPQLVCVDADFYTERVKDKLEKRPYNFIISGSKLRGNKSVKQLIDGAHANSNRMWNARPWEIGVDKSRSDKEKDHWLLVNPSMKRISLSDTGVADYSNWEIYYTDINPFDFDGGGDALAERYRLRWGVETEYRMLKEEFLVKSASTEQEKREFAVMLGFLWDAMWRAAACRLAQDRGTEPKDEEGRYIVSALEFMSAMSQDYAPIDIGNIENLSERSNVVRYCSDSEI